MKKGLVKTTSPSFKMENKILTCNQNKKRHLQAIIELLKDIFVCFLDYTPLFPICQEIHSANSDAKNTAVKPTAAIIVQKTISIPVGTPGKISNTDTNTKPTIAIIR